MKKKETRWYLLWFFTSGMWLITFCLNFFSGNAFDFVIFIQLCNIVLSFAAGIVNRNRYKKRNGEDDTEK